MILNRLTLRPHLRTGRRVALGIGSLALLLSALGCPPAGTPNPPPPPPPPAGDGLEVGLEEVAAGLVSPVALASPDDGSGRLFVVDQIGLIRVIDADGELLDAPFLDVRGSLVELDPDFDERGLIGLAFHPAYAENGRFFVFYTRPPDAQTPEDFDSFNVVSEFSVSDDDPDAADPGSERVLLRIDKPQFNHNGGQLAFGPDGFLYIGVGDGGAANDVGVGHTPELGNGQDKTTLLGKILRIDVDGDEPFEIPTDNPFVDAPDALAEIWAFGLRNPWRFSFDTAGERALFAGDAGQDFIEEVDLVERGGNYGWNIKEGTACFDPVEPGSPPGTCSDEGAEGEPLIDPIIEYPHFSADSELVGIAVIGGFVYRGTAIPELAGQYVFGDYSTGFETGDGALFASEEAADGIWSLDGLTVSGSSNGRINRFILGFGQDADGEIYVLTSDVIGPVAETGRVFKLVPAPVEGVTDVTIRNIAFTPKEVTVRRGETVRWTNLEEAGIPHTVTSGAPGGADAGEQFDSEALDPGQSFTQTFDQVGEFTFFCRIHSDMPDMRDARITVVEE